MTTTDGPVTEHAYAKVNLSLHVTGQRDDGYHLLDSIVMFTSVGDVVTVRAASELSLEIDGPFAEGLLAEDNNLVLRAAHLMDGPSAHITLTKNLPVASGIGGGSADAAATCRALSRLWDLPVPDATALMALGADVPVCMTANLSRMRGIGDQIETFGPAPILDMILVNPNAGVSTPQVFGDLTNKNNPAMSEPVPDPFDTEDWLDWLATQRNDLEPPACAIAPIITEVLGALNAQDGCRLARMSGSGATCFAVFNDHTTRDSAAASIRHAHPDWWVSETDEAPA